MTSVGTSSAAEPLQCEHGLFDQITGEYLELPSLRLTLEQAMRLFALDRTTCTHVLDELVGAGFLTRDATDRYARSAED